MSLTTFVRLYAAAKYINNNFMIMMICDENNVDYYYYYIHRYLASRMCLDTTSETRPLERPGLTWAAPVYIYIYMVSSVK